MMKRNGDIASLFQKHAAKKAVATAANASSPSTAPVATPKEHPQEQERVIEEIVNPRTSSPPPVIHEDVSPPTPPPVYDINHLPYDAGERLPIESYPVNDQDAIRRAYILNGPFHPYAHIFPKRKIGKRDRQFNFV
jgi:hypothetical protein